MLMLCCFAIHQKRSELMVMLGFLCSQESAGVAKWKGACSRRPCYMQALNPCKPTCSFLTLTDNVGPMENQTSCLAWWDRMAHCLGCHVGLLGLWLRWAPLPQKHRSFARSFAHGNPDPSSQLKAKDKRVVSLDKRLQNKWTEMRTLLEETMTSANQMDWIEDIIAGRNKCISGRNEELSGRNEELSGSLLACQGWHSCNLNCTQRERWDRSAWIQGVPPGHGCAQAHQFHGKRGCWPAVVGSFILCFSPAMSPCWGIPLTTIATLHLLI